MIKLLSNFGGSRWKPSVTRTTANFIFIHNWPLQPFRPDYDLASLLFRKNLAIQQLYFFIHRQAIQRFYRKGNLQMHITNATKAMLTILKPIKRQGLKSEHGIIFSFGIHICFTLQRLTQNPPLSYFNVLIFKNI